MSALFGFFVLMTVTGVVCLTAADKLYRRGEDDACWGLFAAGASSGLVAMLTAVILFGYPILIACIAGGILAAVSVFKEAY